MVVHLCFHSDMLVTVQPVFSHRAAKYKRATSPAAHCSAAHLTAKAAAGRAAGCCLVTSLAPKKPGEWVGGGERRRQVRAAVPPACLPMCVTYCILWTHRAVSTPGRVCRAALMAMLLVLLCEDR